MGHHLVTLNDLLCPDLKMPAQQQAFAFRRIMCKNPVHPFHRHLYHRAATFQWHKNYDTNLLQNINWAQRCAGLDRVCTSWPNTSLVNLVRNLGEITQVSRSFHTCKVISLHRLGFQADTDQNGVANDHRCEKGAEAGGLHLGKAPIWGLRQPLFC